MNSTKNIIELRILHGLPASGKSTWANQYKKENNRRGYKVFVADTDLIAKKKCEDFDDLLDDSINMYNTHDFSLIIDGLFLTSNDIVNVINNTIKYFSNPNSYLKKYEFEFKIIVDTWNEDRETCLINDSLRNRDEKATTTIQNATFEKIILKDIKSKLSDKRIKSVTQNRHYVYSPSSSEIFFIKNHIKNPGDENKIYGERWCTGGAYGNCWDDTMSPVTPDEPPKYFHRLVDILEDLEMKQPLTVRSYFEIMDKCVEIDSDYESDYYGGGSYYSQYVLDLTKFYDYLCENGLI